MPLEVLVRSATVEDARMLAVLRYRFRAETGQPVESEEAFVARAAPWLARRLERASWRAWVALDAAGIIVGHVFIQFVEKVPNPVPEAETLGYLTNFYVAPSQRNRGLGARLIESALAACEGMDVETVFLRPTERSVPLYRRSGFVEADLLERPIA
jgi:GNAT superfamily N-acetyltransferase